MSLESPLALEVTAVSYTHLDVYKRQALMDAPGAADIDIAEAEDLRDAVDVARSLDRISLFRIMFYI